MFELGSLRELVLHADSTWARLPPALGKLTALERLEVRMRIDGGCAQPPSVPALPVRA